MNKKPIVQLFPLLAFLGLCIAIISMIGSLAGIHTRRTILKSSQAELDTLQTKNQDLDKKLQIVQSPEFIEQEAREKLNLAKQGETIILMGQLPGTQEETQQSTQTITNWRKWWNLFF